MVLQPLTPERRRQQTREYLLQAAAQVFSERGFHGASLDEVAAVAGFTKGAVYSNFKSKEDLFLALLESRYEHEMDRLRATLDAAEGAPEAHLADFAALLGDQYQSGPDWTALYQEFSLYAMRNPVARQKLADFDRADVASVASIIETERERHGIVTTEPTEHVARIVVALMRGIGTMRTIDASVVDESFLETVMAFVARAMTSYPAEPEPPA
jgi:AcrR family transcriptional regulator